MSKKILIVDDEQDIRIYLDTLFKKDGYETAIAEDGISALKMLEEFDPDLITLDLQMPNDTGTDFYRKIHRNEKYNSIPIIVISGMAGRHLAISKPLAVYEKPIDPAKLLETVKSSIG